jgi:hypothetical protein
LEQLTVDLGYGTVSVFIASKGYGFLEVATRDGVPWEDDVFFHLQDGQFVGRLETSPCFIGARIMLNGQPIQLCAPEEGDHLVFIWDSSRNGKPKAHPWGYADAWDVVANLDRDLLRTPGNWEDEDPHLILDRLR